MSETKKIVHVSGAVLRNAEGKVLIVQRPAHKPLPLMWEFPGGKIEPGETPQEATIREIYEEINLTLKPENLEPYVFLSQMESWGHMVMLVFLCKEWEGELVLREGQPQYAWVSTEELRNYLLPEADLPIIQRLEQDVKAI